MVECVIGKFGYVVVVCFGVINGVLIGLFLLVILVFGNLEVLI